jgi:hypothetical protein
MEQQTQYYHATSRGWGVAAFIVALAVACVVGAAWIHTSTYMHPTHPLRPAGGLKPDAEAAPH